MTAKPVDAVSTIPANDFAEAHRQLLADRAIQFDLPIDRPTPPPAWWGQVGDVIQAILPALRVIFWTALAVGILFLLYVIAMRLLGREWRWRRKPGEEAPDWRPEAAPARQLLGEADVLAGEGRYSEAARLLLYRSIEDIDSRRPELVRPALTSRDIAALPAIPDRPRSAFARIAMLVERSLFAGRALDSGDWRDCRSAYEEFAFVEGWRG